MTQIVEKGKTANAVKGFNFRDVEETNFFHRPAPN
jgi:hypothetical protein